MEKRRVALVFLVLILFTSSSSQADFLATQGFGECTSPTVVVGSDGLARIAFSSYRTGQWQIYWGLYDQVGNCLNGPVQVTTSGSASTAPRMDIDGEDRCFLIWFEGAGTSATQSFARIEADGTIGVAPTAFSLVTGTKRRADLATTADGTNHIVLEYVYATFYRIRYGVLDEDGNIVRSLLTSDVDIFGLNKYPSIDVDPNGIATMTWYDYAGFFSEGLYAAQYNAAGGKLFGGQIVSGEDMYWTTVLTPDGNGVWILFQQRVSGTDRVKIYQGGGAAGTISPAPGPTRKPRIEGTPGNPIYAVWEDWSLGRSRIMASEWDGAAQQVNDAILVSTNTVDATAPDIGTNADGQYYVVWKAGANIFYDSIRNYRLTVTAQVRAAHEDDPYLDPPPPLPGVSVTMTAGAETYTAETNYLGVAQFAVDPEDPVSYDLTLDGSYYRIFTQKDAPDYVEPVTVSYTPPPGETASAYLWQGGDGIDQDPALQVAYDIQDFRRNYWEARLGYDWDLWSLIGHPERTAIQANIYHYNTVLSGESGGASAGGPFLSIMDYKCDEASTVRHELSHNFVADLVRRHHDRTTIRLVGSDWEGEAIDEALADYFAASYANDPVIDRCFHDLRLFCVSLRNIANPNIFQYPLKYPTCGFGYESHEGSVILSSALWNLRGALDGSDADQAPVTDALVLGAAQRMLGDDPANGTSYTFDDFYEAMIDEGLATGGAHQDEISITLGDHNMGPGKEAHCPKSFAEGAGVTSLVGEGATQVRLSWNQVEDATYTVKVKVQDWLNDGIFMADDYYPLATGLTDTTFVFDGRDPHTEYLFVVQPVDPSGEVGFRSEPAFLEAYDLSAVPEQEGVPARVAGRILCNTPNPFNPVTTIHFEVRNRQEVRVEIYDLSGRRVRDLGSLAVVPGGNRVVWNGRDGRGRSLASGVYAVLIRGQGWSDHSKIALLK